MEGRGDAGFDSNSIAEAVGVVPAKGPGLAFDVDVGEVNVPVISETTDVDSEGARLVDPASDMEEPSPGGGGGGVGGG